MKIKWLLILFCAGIFLGCSKEEDTGPLTLNEELTLKTGDLCSSPANDLSVKVLKIYDSRCPIGVVCFWQGEATVHLEVKETQKYEVVLSTVFNPSDTINHYIFKLIDVLPYPVYNVEVPDSDKKVILQIEKI